jgi:hypothetical protein
MKSFLDWLKEEKLDLPAVTDAGEGEVNADAPAEEKTVEEKTKRTGLSANYPPAYVSAQYPHKYFNPSKATADLDIKNIEDENVVTPKV